MKRTLIFLLILCTLPLSACTRDTLMQPTASPTAQASSTPTDVPGDMSTNMPDAVDDLLRPDTASPGTDASAAQTLQDGVYAAEMSDEYVAAQGHGWQDYLKITVTNGIIENIEFDSLKDGKKKSAVSADEYPMNPPPSEWIPKLNEAIRKAEVPEAMDTISGATMSSVNARRMYEALLERARTGNTEIVVLNAE